MKIEASIKPGVFDPQDALYTAGVGRNFVEFRRGEVIFSQGDGANSILYIQKGRVKFSVVNGSGKEAVVSVFGPRDFFGEGCMAGQSVRAGTATALTPSTIFFIDKNEMTRVLSAEHDLSKHFIAYLLEHNVRVEEDLIDQLCTSSEKRMARALLLLAGYGKQKWLTDALATDAAESARK